MRRLDPLIFALGFVGSLVALPALAQQQTFFNEFSRCSTIAVIPSLAKAQKDGITLGLSVNPPEAWLDEQTKQAKGIDWDINQAALDWMGVKNIKLEWMPWESEIPGAPLEAHRCHRRQYPSHGGTRQGDQLQRPRLLVRPGNHRCQRQPARRQVLRRSQGQTGR